MTPTYRIGSCTFVGAVLATAAVCLGQITANESDGVLNAPYRGTITSLRTACEPLSYGEVRAWIEPQVTPLEITGTIELWINTSTEWDRSVLRLYKGLDASEGEVRLDQSSSSDPILVTPDSDGLKRLSLKAIATKTLTPLQFTFHYSYPTDGGPSEGTRTFVVAPMTGSFLGGMPGLQEAFHFGTEILRVSVGGAELVVPVGRTAEMIGATFDFRENEGWDRNDTVPPYSRKMYTTDALLPGAAESVYLQQVNQFRLNHSSYTKSDWGTPWPGHLPGFYNSGDTFGPDGTHYDSFTGTSSTVSTIFRRYDRVRPFDVPDAAGEPNPHPASIRYEYDNSIDNRVTTIRDQQASANSITLARTAGVVTGITTSDGRGWTVQSDPVDGWITGIVPDSGKGARYFEYNAAGRVTRIKDAQSDVLYEFVYANDASGSPTILQAERRLVDGTLRTVVEHEVVSPTLERRKEYVAAGQFRQYDFAYDGARLVSTTTHRDLNGGGPTDTTTYVRDVDNAAGTVKLTQVQLPDGTTLNHEYDHHVGSGSFNFGFRTKTTRTGPNDGSLVTYDADYEFFYNDGVNRLFWQPRIVKQRDGRGMASEVGFDYENGGLDENGDQLFGQYSNQLLSRSGPTIALGTSGTRTPETTYEYYGQVTDGFRRLHFVRTKYDASSTRNVETVYDSLLRVGSQTVDPGGLNLVTQFLYCDASPTQNRITADANGYWTRTQYDSDGRVAAVDRFLPNTGLPTDACAQPTVAFYRTIYAYDANGYLDTQTADNKDQDGNPLVPATIVTDYTPDDLGRVTMRKVDPTVVGQETHFDYNWLNDIEREYDTSGRGRQLAYDGRGLVSSKTPLALGQTPDTNLTTTNTYDAMGRRTFTYPPTHPLGPHEERVYDDFGRLEQVKRYAGDGSSQITTTYEYDAANNVTRTLVDEDGVILLSDATALYDEGGFNYESRQRTMAGADNTADPLTQRKFDWAGNVIEETSLGDDTVGPCVISTTYDGAGRVERVQDSLGGETVFTRDKRGNVEEQRVKLNASDVAVTSNGFDALGRTVRVVDADDNNGQRHYRQRFYDSRGNVRRQTAYQEAGATDVAKQTTVLAYDNAGRQTQQAVLRNAAGWATPPNVATDRVVDSMYDPDGRLTTRKTYNNGTAAELLTVTTYDNLGRVDRVTDPSGSYVDDDYFPNGRFQLRTVFDGVSPRVFEADLYDGHDRVISQTAAGAGSDPDLVTGFEYDGLDRRVAVTDPNLVTTRTGFDLVGRRVQVTENVGGAALERMTTFAYNRLSQLIARTAANKDSTGLPLANQVTTYRSDSLGRETRIVYPDAPSGDHANPDTCTDCVKLVYDLAGRMSQRQDQRNTTVYAYDRRSLPRTRTTGTTVDTFDQDALGRTILADRGTSGNPAATSHAAMAYNAVPPGTNDLGDLLSETQAIQGGTARTVPYTYDQAGNRTQLTYPGGTVLAYAPTALNQVDTVKVGVNPLVDYTYAGRRLQGRTTTTSAVGGTATYQQEWGYDSHRRINAITNSVDIGGGPQTVADYAFTHDAVGNPLSQVTVTGLPDFLGDDRLFGVDDLNRLVGTDYLGSGEAESTSFDLVGNREAHTNRAGETSAYTLANPANEYALIGPSGVAYDAAGNLAVDEAGRQYSYDEQNRLTEVREPLPATGTLARYTYDALGRRIVFEDPIGGTTIRYYYDGVNPIEERDATEVLVRYHVHGAQYIDERVGTYDTGVGGLRAAGWSYYLLNDNFSIAGTGDGGGTIARLDYSATGDLTGGAAGYFFDADGNNTIDLLDWASLASCLLGPDVPAGAGCGLHDFTRDGHVDLADAAVFQRYFNQSGTADLRPLSRSGNYAHDWDGDRDVDLDDFGAFFACVDTPPGDPLPPSCLAVHDFDNWGVSDGQVTGDLLFGDFGGFQHCFTVETWTPPTPADCFRAGPGGSAPTSGMFALHGQPVDVLADPDGPSGPQTALALQYSRARYFDLKHARWLQHDPSGYTDGNNLYEAFRGNAVRFTDPDGKQVPIVAGYRIDEYMEMSRRAGIELGGTPEDQAALGRLGKTAGVVALNVIPYAFGGVPGVAVNLVTLSMVAPTAYYERQGQFMETTGQSLNFGEAFAIVVSDVTGVSTGYLIVSGEDLLTLAQASPDARVESLAHLSLALGTVKGTAAFLPTIRSGVAVAGGRTAGGVIGIEEAGGMAAPRISFEPLRGDQLRFPFAEPAPVPVKASAGANLPVLVVDYARYPELADNIWHAQKAGRARMLTYGGSNVIARNRAAALKGVPKIAGLTRDEYPFASSVEGGSGAWIGHIPPTQQDAQGALIWNLLRQHNLRPGDLFWVQVVNHPGGL